MKQPSATVFFDIVAAFDAVPLPLLWGSDAAPTEQYDEFHRRGFDQRAAAAMAQHLHAHPCILQKVGLPESFLPLLRSWGSSTWLVTEESQVEGLSPHTGVPQGHNLSALLFDVFFADIMQDADKRFSEANLCLELPLPYDRGLQVRDDAALLPIGGVAFRDDLAVPLTAPDNPTLIEMVAKATDIVAEVLRQRHLTLNLSKGKTECTLHLMSASSKAYMQGLRMVGKATNLGAPAIQLAGGGFIIIAEVYPHLGRAHCQNGAITQEIKCRIGKASAAYQHKRPVLASSKFTIRSRVKLFNTYVTCHLTQNSGISPSLSEINEYMKLKSCYVGLLRKALKECSSAQEVTTMTDTAFYEKYSITSFQTLVDRRRLKVLMRLLTVDAPVLQAMLAATSVKGSVWSGLFSSMERLRLSAPDLCSDLPAPSLGTLPQWASFVINHHSTWDSIVAKHKYSDHAKRCRPDAAAMPRDDPDMFQGEVDEDMLVGELRLPADERPKWTCPHEGCTFIAKSSAGLAMHTRRKHGDENPLSLRLVSNLCPACRLPFDTRHRALDHLRAGRRCREYVLEHVQPLSPTAHRHAIEQLLSVSAA
eukprot:2622705-Amphidinium_carterae.2